MLLYTLQLLLAWCTQKRALTPFLGGDPIGMNMPRKPRFILPGVPLHVVQRGHNQSDIFFQEEDREAYLGWLQEAAERYRCRIHAYVLMTNHVHLLITPKDKEGASRMMQYVGRRYVPYINRVYGKIF